MDKNQLLEKLKTRFSIVATIGGERTLKSIKLALDSGADIIELRIDDMAKTKKEQTIRNLVRDIRKTIELPIIATIRTAKEQDISSSTIRLSDAKRLKIFKSIIDYVDLVDIELGSKSINQTVIRQAHKNDKLVIVSHHDFNKTPSSVILNRYAQRSIGLGADIVKIAVMAKSKEDAGRLLMFCESWNKSPITVISMGHFGTISRVVGFAYKSCLTYGYINKSYAPGQLSVKELRSYIEAMRRRNIVL